MDKILDFACSIQGWMSRPELQWLYETASSIPAKFSGIWVELGVWKGRSFAATAMGLPSGYKLYGIDYFKGNPGSKLHQEAKNPDKIKQAFLQTIASIRAQRLDIEMFLVDKTCEEAAQWFQDQNLTIDAIFIDADHSAASVEVDIRSWWPILTSHGLMMGHDYGGNHKGIKEAVDRTLSSFMRGPGSIWYVQKKMAYLYLQDSKIKEQS